MENLGIITLPRDPLSLSFPEKYTSLSRKEVRKLKRTFKEKLWAQYFSPLEWDYSEYIPLLENFLDEKKFSQFKGFFGEAFARDWLSRLGEVSLEEKVNETINFKVEGKDNIKLAKYKSVNLGVVVKRNISLTEIDLLGFYSNGFKAGFHVEVKSGYNDDYHHQHVRRNVYTYLKYPFEETPILYVHVHSNNICFPYNIKKTALETIKDLEDRYGNLIIIEFPYKDISLAARIAFETLMNRKKRIRKETRI